MSSGTDHRPSPKSPGSVGPGEVDHSFHEFAGRELDRYGVFAKNLGRGCGGLQERVLHGGLRDFGGCFEFGLGGAVPPAEGEVLYDNIKVEPDVPQNVKRGIAFVPQGHNVFPNLSVQQNLNIAGLLFDTDFVTRVFEIFPVLNERRAQRAGSLSGAPASRAPEPASAVVHE